MTGPSAGPIVFSISRLTRALRLASNGVAIFVRTRDLRLVTLALRKRRMAWEMAFLLRAGIGISVRKGGYFIRCGDATFRFAPEEFATGLSAIGNRFVAGEYADLEVRDAVVVDVGAFIGDTALYFLQRGAYRVLAFEPVGVTFARAAANVERSRAADRIDLVNAGVASRSGVLAIAHADVPSPELVTVPPDGWPASDDAEGDTVRLVSFREVLEKAAAVAEGRRIVCKLDCEGAEFDIFLAAPLPEGFGQVAQVIMETHRLSPIPIVRLLEAEGFDVRVEARPVPSDPKLAMVFAARRHH